VSKKDKKHHQDEITAPESNLKASGVSKRGWKIIGTGILTVVAGFIVLSFTDSRGQNLPSVISPFLLIVGYALIAVGIITKDPA